MPQHFQELSFFLPPSQTHPGGLKLQEGSFQGAHGVPQLPSKGPEESGLISSQTRHSWFDINLLLFPVAQSCLTL